MWCSFPCLDFDVGLHTPSAGDDKSGLSVIHARHGGRCGPRLNTTGIWGIVRELAARRLMLLAAKPGTGAG